MSYTLLQLITNAYYLSGKVSRQFETVQGDDLTDGLRLLNTVLSTQAIKKRMIPFFSYYTFNTVVGTEDYLIPNLLEIENITFNIDVVRFPITIEDRTQYFGSFRVDNVTTLPSRWHLEREKTGSRIFLFPLPAAVYVVKLWGKFGLLSVSKTDLSTDLESIYETNYIEYLRYLLARKICAENNITFQQQANDELMRLEKIFRDVSPIDFTLQKQSLFKTDNTLNWGMVNLYKGWVP